MKRSRAAIQTTDAFEKRASLTVALARRRRRPDRPGKGAGHDLAGLRDAAVFVQTDAACPPRPRPAARRDHQTLVRADLRRRSAVDERHGDPPGSGASGIAVEPETEDELRFGEALDALCASSRCSSSATARARGGRARGGARRRAWSRRASRAGGRELAAGQDRAVRRGPELGADRPGHRDGDARHRAASGRHRDRGHPGVRQRRATSPRRAGLKRRCSAGGRVRDRPARRGRRDRGVLLRPRPRVRDDQRRLHDMTEHGHSATSPRSSRRSRTSASSTARPS